jgi:hypothetical protein
MNCERCGASLGPGARFCQTCGTTVAAATAPAGDNPVSYIVPYRNGYALAAYYLGIFSLIPCLGGVLGLAACPLGIVGLRHAGRHPEAHGRIHAWVGVVLGGLSALAHIALGVLMMIGASGA